MRDLSLVVFTVLSQLAIGSFITLWIYDRRSKQKISTGTGFFLSVSIFLMTIASLVASLFHLGHPLHAYKAILNVGESWLSREIVFFGLFIGLIAIYSLLWKNNDVAKRNMIGWLSAIVGILAIFSSGMIYVVPAVPAWNNIFTLVFFFITAALLGPLYVGVVLVLRKEVAFNFSMVALGAIIVSIVTLAVYVSTLLSGLDQAVMTANDLIANSLFWVRVAVLLVSFILVGIGIRRKQTNFSYYGAVFTLLIIGEFIGRTLFYTTAIHL